MSTLTVALLQLARPGPDLEANLTIGERACQRARAIGADIALFPEMWSTGYTCALPRSSPERADLGDLLRAPELWGGAAAPGADQAAVSGVVTGSARPAEPSVLTAPAHAAGVPSVEKVWADLAVDADSRFVSHFRDLAAELDLAIALTYLERWDGPPRNSVSLIDRHGELALTYAKVHTCAFDLPEAALTPGERFDVCALDTAAGTVMVGAMICYDREFPESARSLMLAGAEIILTPNSCDLDMNRLAQFRTRAHENMVGVAMTNYAGRGMGHSVAYDGVGFAGGHHRDMLVVEAGEAEGIYPAVFDLDALRDFRQRETWGDAFRRPVAYGSLTATGVRPPFVRADRHGRTLHR